MARPNGSQDAAIDRQIDAALQRLRNAKDNGPEVVPLFDIAIRMTGADMGTLQRFDEKTDSLELVASRGFSTQALSFFGTVRRDTGTSCAVALSRRMRVSVEDISTSYLYVGTRERAMLSAGGFAAV